MSKSNRTGAQLVLPCLPAALAHAAQRFADRCECWSTHERGLSAEPCFCDCHAEPWPPIGDQMKRDSP